jgi:parvulin-like peptidyl-prolyl isomerase
MSKGVKAKVRQTKFRYLAVAIIAVASLAGIACDPKTTTGSGAGEAAAMVNGKAISMEQVERIIKQQGQGQESKLSPLELAQARLQVLQGLIQQEVMFQKAEQEKTIPTDDEVNAKFNEFKTQSGESAEGFEKKMKEVGETEATVRERIKRDLAINKLVEKITGKVEPPKDSEVEAFYNGNKEAFVKKRGVKLAGIVIDPRNNGQGDTTVDEATTAQKIKDIGTKIGQGADFATVARAESEDQSRLQGGDLGYFSEDQLKQNFPQLAAGFMNPQFAVGRAVGPFNIEGRFYFLKLQERVEKEEALTLESQGVRQQITDSLINARKNLLSESYAAIAMSEARIDNLLAKKVVENPNELSGARPASASSATANSNANTAANSGSNANTASNAASNTAANTKPAEGAKPESNASSNAASNGSSNSNAGK